MLVARLGLLLPLAVGAACGSSQEGGGASSSPADAGATPPLSITPGFSLAEREGVARGEGANSRCKGAFPAAPQFRMALPENMTGMVVEAHGDGLTLLVRRGVSAWCGQAEGGLVKVGRGAWSKGEYELLVGTTDPGGEKPFRLRVAEIDR